MINNMIENVYFDWLCSFTVNRKNRPAKTYFKLLSILHDVEFNPIIPNDENRYEDGISLRLRFSRCHKRKYTSDRPCSILEMMIALALRCEEQIMDDPDIGNRTSFWFWKMIRNMGLFNYSDDKLNSSNRSIVVRKLKQFNDREYKSDGSGGLFVIKDCHKDLRDVEIWYQMCWYLDGLI